MAEFFSRSNPRPVVPTPCGSKVIPDYVRKVEDGVFILVEHGTRDIYAHIQASLQPGGVYAIIDAYARTGDKSLLQIQKGQYIDATTHPRSLAELEQLRIDSRERFYSLPLAVRRLFNNNPEQFIANSDKALAYFEGLNQGDKAVVSGQEGSAHASGANTTSSNGGSEE